MQKQILTIIMLFISAFSMACSCEDLSPILEFYSSKYVFEGKIISKVYAKDSLTYKVTFDILKHYKKADFLPKTLEFEVKAEGEYTGEYTSCDWSANKGETWLVYAYLWNDELCFSKSCSNSKIIDKYPISLNEQRMLDNGDSFNINDYIFQNEGGFNYSKNITDIDSILAKGKIKDYKTNYTVLMLSIDTLGNLKSVIERNKMIQKRDELYGFITEILEDNSKPTTEFEKDAIELISQVKKWEVKRYRRTGDAVPYITHLWVEYDTETNKWSYWF